MRKRKGVRLRCLPYVIVFALGFAAAYAVSAIIKVLLMKTKDPNFIPQ
jgi:hypothetical protein